LRNRKRRKAFAALPLLIVDPGLYELLSWRMAAGRMWSQGMNGCAMAPTLDLEKKA